MMSGLLNAAWGALGSPKMWLYLAGAAAVGYLWWDYESLKDIKEEQALQIQTLERDLSAANAKVEAANAQIKELLVLRESDQKTIIEISGNIAAMSKTITEYQALIESYKTRGSVVLRNPSAIEYRANKATEKVFENLSCVIEGEC